MRASLYWLAEHQPTQTIDCLMNSSVTPDIKDRLRQLENMVDAARHALDATHDAIRVAQFMDTLIFPVVATLIYDVVGYSSCT